MKKNYKKKENNNKQQYVKQKGYDNSFNNWNDRKTQYK